MSHNQTVRKRRSVGMEFTLVVDNLPDQCTAGDIESFFSFDGVAPSKCVISGPKGFKSASLWYDSNSLVLIALKNYYGVEYKGHKLSMNARMLPM